MTITTIKSIKTKNNKVVIYIDKILTKVIVEVDKSNNNKKNK